MQNNILFTFAIIFSIFSCAHAQPRQNFVPMPGQNFVQTIPPGTPVLRSTDLGLGATDYFHERYTVKELNKIFYNYEYVVAIKPKDVCVYENVNPINNIVFGSWYYPSDINKSPGWDRAYNYYHLSTEFTSPSSTEPRTLCKITNDPTKVFRYYKEYPGNLNYLWRIWEFKCSIYSGYLNCGIFNYEGMNGVLKYLSGTFNERLGKLGSIYYFIPRKDTFEDNCKRCPCTMKKDLCLNDEIFYKVKR